MFRALKYLFADFFKGAIRYVKKNAGKFIVYVAATFGIYLATSTGADYLVDAVIDQVNSGLAGIAREIFFYLNADDYVTSIISAHGVVAAGRFAFRKKKGAAT